MHKAPKWISLLAALVLCVQMPGGMISGLALEDAAQGTDVSQGEASSPAESAPAADVPDYARYLEDHATDERPQIEPKVLPAGGYSAIHPTGGYEVLGEYAGQQKTLKNVLLIQESLEYVEYVVSMEQAGLYELAITHFPMNGTASRYEIGLQLDGQTPFSQASSMYVNNIFHPESDEVFTDQSGNQFAPDRVAVEDWTTGALTNPDNNYDESLRFYLHEGENRIRLTFHYPDPFVLGALEIRPITSPMTYEEYRQIHTDSPSGSQWVQVEAEDADRQSDSILRPTSDRTDRMTSPYSASLLLANVIDSSWSGHGQWLEWDVEVPETGFYRLNFRYQQDGMKGMAVGRRLLVDGEVPFAEAEYMTFPYASHWSATTFSDADGNPYYIFLKKGTRTIRMESVLGDIAVTIRGLDDVIRELNELYRQIIMITSTTPDKYQDYYLDRDIPNLLERFASCRDALHDAYEKMAQKGDMANSTVLRTLEQQLDSFIRDPRSVPGRITSFQTNISSVSAWVLDMRSQPLALDYFLLEQVDAPAKKMVSNVWDKIVHTVQSFGYSFVQDYNNFSADGAQEKITIWLNTGRDQAQVLWKMTNDLFTPKYGIGVEVKLVGATMVEAFLSGNSPDVAINATRDTPVNLALRDAVLDLTDFEGFDEVYDWFQEGALIPYTLQDGVYGLPDTQVFHMLFYRTDILEELDLQAPQTWDDFIRVANQLHLYQLETGVPADATTFYSLLLQNGGELFPEDRSQVILDSPEALVSFRSWTDLFSKVGLPLTYDMFNRFRTGEMPMAIAPYTTYNQLVSAAPEIRNLWEMAPIPGIRQEDGSINRLQSGTGTAAIILSATKNPDAAWKFIRWWAGREAQSRYAQDIESRVGMIGRIAVANKDAFTTLDWGREQLDLLVEQHQAVRELPQVPGNYYLDRDLINAFRDVTINERDPVESILEYSKRINGEIQRKREEFGLE